MHECTSFTVSFSRVGPGTPQAPSAAQSAWGESGDRQNTWLRILSVSTPRVNVLKDLQPINPDG